MGASDSPLRQAEQRANESSSLSAGIINLDPGTFEEKFLTTIGSECFDIFYSLFLVFFPFFYLFNIVFCLFSSWEFFF
jgi:hypothetical protein